MRKKVGVFKGTGLGTWCVLGCAWESGKVGRRRQPPSGDAAAAPPSYFVSNAPASLPFFGLCATVQMQQQRHHLTLFQMRQQPYCFVVCAQPCSCSSSATILLCFKCASSPTVFGLCATVQLQLQRYHCTPLQCAPAMLLFFTCARSCRCSSSTTTAMCVSARELAMCTLWTILASWYVPVLA
eukprot:1159407-Pelagomonas_calceolata.AAC.2